MKRSIGIGDILICVGLAMMLAFLIICLITGGSSNSVTGGYKRNAWPLINGILLGVLILGDGALFAYSLSNTKILNVQYIFAGFIILLHIVSFQALAPYGFKYAGMPFYIFTGALLVGVGTYLAKEGMGIIIGGETKAAKKKKD